MQRTVIRQLLQSGQDKMTATVCGWVRTKRVSKNFAFLSINDGSCQDSLQIVLNPESKAFECLKDINTGASVRASGELAASPGHGQQWELQAQDLELIGAADAEAYPLQKKGHTLEFLRDVAHLRPRTNTFGAVFRVRNRLARAVHDFFQSRGFVWAHTPIITASDCEGAGELFTVSTLNPDKLPRTDAGKVDYSKDFFGKQAFLTVSGQLEGEFLALSLGDIYTFGPTFRAENSNTARHLAEFWMIEPEIAFANLQDNMKLAEDFIRCVLRDALKDCGPELSFLEKTYQGMKMSELERIANDGFERITYTEAVKLLTSAPKKFEFPVKWGSDLQTEHERYLTEVVFRKPVIVTDYPKDIKAFYMRVNDDDKTVAGMDVLVPGIGELIGGAQREDRLDILSARMEGMGIPLAGLQWYLDLRRYGSVPHAGFGLGFERLVMYVTGMSNIRDVILCPRAPSLIAF